MDECPTVDPGSRLDIDATASELCIGTTHEPVYICILVSPRVSSSDVTESRTEARMNDCFVVEMVTGGLEFGWPAHKLERC